MYFRCSLAERPSMRSLARSLRVRGARRVADPSGGAADSYTLAIAHAEQGIAVLDVVREIRAPFSPDQATAEYAALLKSYGLSTVGGDYYSAEWVVERFRQHGIAYRRSEQSKSQLYAELLGPLSSGRVRLLDNPVLRGQLLGLERRTSRGGHDSIDHPPRGRDDLINAAAGAIVAVAAASKYTIGGQKITI